MSVTSRRGLETRRTLVIKMATETASECKIIVKKPMLLKVGDLASEFRSGVSVVDIILPGMNAVQVVQNWII